MRPKLPPMELAANKAAGCKPSALANMSCNLTYGNPSTLMLPFIA